MPPDKRMGGYVGLWVPFYLALLDQARCAALVTFTISVERKAPVMTLWPP